MRRNALSILFLVALLALIDQLYRGLHPEVNLVRASLVGATAYGALQLLGRVGFGPVSAWRGALAIAGSAFGSVLLIQAGWLTSRSPRSVLVHGILLAVVFLASGFWSPDRRGARGGAAHG